MLFRSCLPAEEHVELREAEDEGRALVDQGDLDLVAEGRTTPEIAEDWIAVDRLLTDVPGGVAIAITVMAVDHPAYVMQLIREAKRRNPGRSVYWKRYFPDQRPAQGRAVRIAKSERQ